MKLWIIASAAALLWAAAASGGNGEMLEPLAPGAGDFLDANLNDYVAAAVAAYNDGRYEEAARLYLTYLRSNVGDAVSIYNLACCYGLLGEAELAAGSLRRAFAAGYRDVAFAAQDPDFDKVRDAPAFAAAFEEMKAGADVGDARTLYVQAPSVLPCYVILPENYDAKEKYTLVIGLHGRGGDGARFTALRRSLGDAPFIFAAPQGPYPIGMVRAAGYGWAAEVPDRLEGVRQQSYEASARYVAELAAALRARYNVGDVYLLGFSQGAFLAYCTAVRNVDTFRGVACFSGYYRPAHLTAEELDAARGLRVFIAHGKAETAIPYAEAEAAYELLSAYGYDVTFRGFDGGHEMPGKILEEVGRWMTE
jgi:phospholipase/carboxylesterase